jgi:type III pantothenate kinase
MTKSLTIDMGNSSAKLAIYAGDVLIDRQRVGKVTCDLLASVVEQHAIEEGILSSVTKIDGHIDDFLHCHLRRYMRLSHSTPLPIGVKYGTPHTLGSDRVATAVGAWYLNPGATSLVVDAGTAATIDVVDAQGNFLGGNIVAGISTRLKALNHYTSALPLVEAEGDTPAWGHDTVTALRSGAVLGLAAEVEATVVRVKEQLNVDKVTVFVTGGDGALLARYMRMEARVDNDLLSNGLYRILRYNEGN